MLTTAALVVWAGGGLAVEMRGRLFQAPPLSGCANTLRDRERDRERGREGGRERERDQALPSGCANTLPRSSLQPPSARGTLWRALTQTTARRASSPSVHRCSRREGEPTGRQAAGGMAHVPMCGLGTWHRWREEDCMLQTFPAALVARMLDVQPGEAVLDMCAAPGGKVLNPCVRADAWLAARLHGACCHDACAPC